MNTDIEEDIVSLEHYGMVGVMGFDYSKEQGRKITVSIPQFMPDAEQATQTFTVEGRLPYEVISRFSSRSEKILTFRQMRVLLFSETFAKEVGLKDILFSLSRDPSVGTNVRIAVVKGTVEDVLNKEYKAHPETTNYLRQLLKPRAATAFNPFTSIHDFIFRMTDEISDPSAPYVEIVGDSLEITRVALFQGDKMVGTLKPEDAKIVEGMKHRKRLPDFIEIIKEENPETNKEEDVMVILKFVEAKYDTKTNGDRENPKIHTSLYIRGVITNYQGYYNVQNMQQRKKLEAKIEEKIQQRMVNSFEQFQELMIDPLGVGYQFRFNDKGKEWNKDIWNNIFKNAEITAHTKVTIISSGAIK